MAKSLIRRDPLREMMKWDPLGELRAMQHDMDRLFDRLLGRDTSVPGLAHSEWTPMVESYVKGNDLVFKCELPGIDPKDVDVTLDETAGRLIIKGERKAEKETRDEDYLFREFTYGNFERQFTLPEGVKTDQLKATFVNGILEITVPAPMIAKGRKIAIESPKAAGGETPVKKAA